MTHTAEITRIGGRRIRTQSSPAGWFISFRAANAAYSRRGATVAPSEEIVTATEQGVRRQTYKETRDGAHELAHALADAGVRVEDRVGTFMWNGSRHLQAYHARAGMGAVLHTLNIRLSNNGSTSASAMITLS